MPTPPNIDDFWKLEAIAITHQEEKEHDKAVIDHFKRQVKKEDGRYYVARPWKDENYKLPENCQLSIGRLKSLQKQLKDDPELLQRYDEVIKDDLEKGMIEVMDEQKKQGDKQHYIPQHAVIKPENNTTKLLAIYNASAKKKKSNSSLSKCLHKGPVTLGDICGLLMRF